MLVGKYFEVAITSERFVITAEDENGNVECRRVDEANQPFGEVEKIHKYEIHPEGSYRFV